MRIVDAPFPVEIHGDTRSGGPGELEVHFDGVPTQEVWATTCHRSSPHA